MKKPSKKYVNQWKTLRRNLIKFIESSTEPVKFDGQSCIIHIDENDVSIWTTVCGNTRRVVFLSKTEFLTSPITAAEHAQAFNPLMKVERKEVLFRNTKFKVG